MPKLSGSLFVRNAIRFDYCVMEAIYSLLGVCDEVIVLECSSDDDTKKMLQGIRHNKLRLLTDAYWACAADHARLAVLANLAKSYAKHEYHFMLQADEVLHEKSYPFIREYVASGSTDTRSVRRVNFYGDPSRQARVDMPLHLKPCDDRPTRLGPVSADALGDAESIAKVNDVIDDRIVICHYGFIRRPMHLVDRTVSTMEWFFDGQPDERFTRMQADREYRYQDIMPDDLLEPYTGTHPKLIRPWLEERWTL